MELNPNTTEVGTVFPGVGGTYSVDPTTGALTLIDPPTFDEPPKAFIENPVHQEPEPPIETPPEN